MNSWQLQMAFTNTWILHLKLCNPSLSHLITIASPPIPNLEILSLLLSLRQTNKTCISYLRGFIYFSNLEMSYSDPNQNPIPETTNDTNSTEAVQQFKLYHALIFSIPICFTFIVLFVFYVIYLRRRSSSVDWSSLGMRGGGSFVSTNNLSKVTSQSFFVFVDLVDYWGIYKDALHSIYSYINIWWV